MRQDAIDAMRLAIAAQRLTDDPLRYARTASDTTMTRDGPARTWSGARSAPDTTTTSDSVVRRFDPYSGYGFAQWSGSRFLPSSSMISGGPPFDQVVVERSAIAEWLTCLLKRLGPLSLRAVLLNADLHGHDFSLVEAVGLKLGFAGVGANGDELWSLPPDHPWMDDE